MPHKIAHSSPTSNSGDPSVDSKNETKHFSVSSAPSNFAQNDEPTISALPNLADKIVNDDHFKNYGAEKNKKRQDILADLSNPQHLVSKFDGLLLIIEDKSQNLGKANVLKLAVEKLQSLLNALIEHEASIKTSCDNPPLSPELQDKLAALHSEFQTKRIEFLHQFDSFKQNINNFTVWEQSKLARTTNEVAPFLNATLNSLTYSVLNSIEKVYPDRTAIQIGLAELFDRHEKACQPWYDLICAVEERNQKIKNNHDDLIKNHKKNNVSATIIQLTINGYEKQLRAREKIKQRAQEQIAEFIKQHTERLAVLNTQLEKTCGTIQSEAELKDALVEFNVLLKILTDKTQTNDQLLKRMKARFYILTQQILMVYKNSNQDIPSNREEGALFAECLKAIEDDYDLADPLWGELHKTASATSLRLNVRRTLSAIVDGLHKTVNPVLGAGLTFASVVIYAVEIGIHSRFGFSKFDSSRANNLGNAVAWTALNSEGLDAAASSLAGSATTTGGLTGFDLPLELKQNRIELKAGKARLKSMQAEWVSISTKLQVFDQKLLTEAEIKEVTELKERQGDLEAEIPETIQSIADVRSRRYTATSIAGAYAGSGIVSTVGMVLTAKSATIGMGAVGSAVSTVGSALGIKALAGLGVFIAGSVLSGGALIIAAAVVTAAVSLSWGAYRFYKWMTSETTAQKLAKHFKAVRSKPSKPLSMEEAELRAKLSMKPRVVPALPSPLSKSRLAADTSCSIAVTPVPPTPAAGLVAVAVKSFGGVANSKADVPPEKIGGYVSTVPAVRPVTAPAILQSTLGDRDHKTLITPHSTQPAVRPATPAYLQTRLSVPGTPSGKMAEAGASPSILRPTATPTPTTGRDSITSEVGGVENIDSQELSTNRRPSTTTNRDSTDSGSDSDGLCSTESSRNSARSVSEQAGGYPEASCCPRPSTPPLSSITAAQLLACISTRTNDNKDTPLDQTKLGFNKEDLTKLSEVDKLAFVKEDRISATEPSANTLEGLKSDIVVNYSNVPSPLASAHHEVIPRYNQG